MNRKMKEPSTVEKSGHAFLLPWNPGFDPVTEVVDEARQESAGRKGAMNMKPLLIPPRTFNEIDDSEVPVSQILAVAEYKMNGICDEEPTRMNGLLADLIRYASGIVRAEDAKKGKAVPPFRVMKVLDGGNGHKEMDFLDFTESLTTVANALYEEAKNGSRS